MYACVMSRTTIAVETTTRDALTAVAAKLGSTSMDDTLRSLLWEHDCNEALARLDADPETLAAYRDEAQKLAEADVTVYEDPA